MSYISAVITPCDIEISKSQYNCAYLSEHILVYLLVFYGVTILYIITYE